MIVLTLEHLFIYFYNTSSLPCQLFLRPLCQFFVPAAIAGYAFGTARPVIRFAGDPLLLFRPLCAILERI